MHSYIILRICIAIYITMYDANAVKFTRVTENTGGKYENAVQSSEVPSLISCALVCDVSEMCLAINYNEGTSSCELVSNLTSPLMDSSAWMSYNKQTSKFYWSICTADNECSNEGCSSTLCNCLVSYRYDWRLGRCVPECGTGFGDSFIEHLNIRLAVTPFVSFSGTNLEECAAMCSNTTVNLCIGFNHNKNNGNCNIKYKESLSEADFVVHNGMSYYTRNCN
ncbi:hypothetical protein ACF0H5_011353 [Mactra antiquata]